MLPSKMVIHAFHSKTDIDRSGKSFHSGVSDMTLHNANTSADSRRSTRTMGVALLAAALCSCVNYRGIHSDVHPASIATYHSHSRGCVANNGLVQAIWRPSTYFAYQ
jgi:hypothetical protein